MEKELATFAPSSRQRVEGLVVQLRGVLHLEVLDKDPAYRVLRRLLNFAPYKAEGPGLGTTSSLTINSAIRRSNVIETPCEWTIIIVKVLTLKEPPPYTTRSPFSRN